MHDGMPYGRNQGQGQGHSREVDRQSPTGLILLHSAFFAKHVNYLMFRAVLISWICEKRMAFNCLDVLVGFLTGQLFKKCSLVLCYESDVITMIPITSCSNIAKIM